MRSLVILTISLAVAFVIVSGQTAAENRRLHERILRLEQHIGISSEPTMITDWHDMPGRIKVNEEVNGQGFPGKLNR